MNVISVININRTVRGWEVGMDGPYSKTKNLQKNKDSAIEHAVSLANQYLSRESFFGQKDSSINIYLEGELFLSQSIDDVDSDELSVISDELREVDEILIVPEEADLDSSDELAKNTETTRNDFDEKLFEAISKPVESERTEEDKYPSVEPIIIHSSSDIMDEIELIKLRGSEEAVKVLEVSFENDKIKIKLQNLTEETVELWRSVDGKEGTRNLRSTVDRGETWTYKGTADSVLFIKNQETGDILWPVD